jgi:nicotinamide phosphoribosyltransferase
VHIITGYNYNEATLGTKGIYIKRDGKDVTICREEWKGVVEVLWDIFGGTTNEKGFRRLNDKIGVIYGDSITLDRANRICERLADKKFESTGWVAGIGSYTYQYVTRDTLGYAMKATYAEVDLNGSRVGIDIFKDPITDDGTKKSARGLMQIVLDVNTSNLTLIDRATWEQEQDSYLEEVFRDGKLLKDQSLSEIRERLWPSKVLA